MSYIFFGVKNYSRMLSICCTSAGSLVIAAAGAGGQGRRRNVVVGAATENGVATGTGVGAAIAGVAFGWAGDGVVEIKRKSAGTAGGVGGSTWLRAPHFLPIQRLERLDEQNAPAAASVAERIALIIPAWRWRT